MQHMEPYLIDYATYQVLDLANIARTLRICISVIFALSIFQKLGMRT